MYKIISRAGSLVISRNTRLLGISTDRKYSAGNDRNEGGCKNHSLLLPSLKTDMASCSTVDEPKHTNRLAQEKSPYLLQHAHNPVDWYPWGEEAIQKAKAENKLIFLSVGYSTCHWCHVMEHESFENEEVAKIMNENFVNIKVDREERPDIDKIYMNFVLMINGSGGWPMSVWLTPDLAPITAGTYFPPMDRWGMPGFKTVLKKIAEKWRNNKTELAETGHKIIQAIQKSLAEKGEEQSPDGPLSSEDKLNQAVRIFKRNFDSDYGGFGSHPKFPEVSRLNFLFHAYVVKKDRDILNMVLKTLTKIGNGGIHDHVFGGFARYSVDQKWHVPHFEKMLYDQGQLLSAYAHAYKITNDEKYLNIADGIFRYLIKDLRHPSGGFYSGEDADSLPTINDKVKIEGAFYAWTYSEIRDAIKDKSSMFEIEPEKAFEIYSYHYNVQESGNVEPSSDPHGHLTAKNILIVRKSAEATCEKFKITRQQFDNVLSTTNEILHEIRDKRPRPHLDTKIITAWNGLILSGLSRLANCGSEKRGEYITAAKDLVNFLRTFSYDKEKKIVLRTCYGKGTGSEITEVLSDPIGGFLDDYAFLIKGLLDYYKATFDMDALEWAKELQDIQDVLFWDERQGGYFYSQENSPNVIVRLKEDHDGAEPCGNSVAARNLQLISVYYEDKSYKERAKKLFEFFSTASPFGYVLPEMMSALLVYERGLEMAAIVGPDSDLTRSLIDVCRKYYIPGIVVVHFDPGKNSFVKRKTLEKFKMINGKPTAYICHNKVCQLPITDPETLEEKLKSNYVLD